MRGIAVIFGIVSFFGLSVAARAGPIDLFSDLDAFFDAAGDVHEIDFETLPDGSPSVVGTLITPEFNYTDQGVDFFSHAPELVIAGNPIGGFGLRARSDQSTGPPNWIIAELVEPATALGIAFPGSTTLILFDTDNQFMGNWHWGGGGISFLGAISEDVPIGTAIVNRGTDGESIESFFFTPVPEPATALILGVGMMALLVRGRNRRGAHRPAPQ